MDEKRLISFTQSLIRAHSLSGEEQEAVGLVIQEMKYLGFDRVWIDDYGSAVGIIQGRRPGKTLLMDGHCDTVSANASDWSVDPFAGVIIDDTLYGRGAADMKGSLAAMIYAAANVDRATLAGAVVVSATVLEEVMEGMALAGVIKSVKPDFVIIGEATNFLLNRAGRGRAEVVLETIGKSAHSSSPQAGICAVHEMLDLIRMVEGTPLPSDPVVGSAQIVLTDILSEPYPGHSVVPNRCRVSYDRRLMPGETPESILSGIKKMDTRDIQFTVSIMAGEEKSYTGMTLRGLKFFPAWKFEDDHPLLQSVLRGLKKAGIETRLGSYNFCTNGSYSAGIADLPTIGFGPGFETDAHTVDEKMKISDIIKAANGFSGMVQSILESSTGDQERSNIIGNKA